MIPRSGRDHVSRDRHLIESHIDLWRDVLVVAPSGVDSRPVARDHRKVGTVHRVDSKWAADQLQNFVKDIDQLTWYEEERSVRVVAHLAV
jgi:hypothetical protein